MERIQSTIRGCAEGDGDAEDGADDPSPGDAVGHGHGAEHHDEDDGDGGEPGEDVLLEGGGAGEEGGRLGEGEMGDENEDEDGKTIRGVVMRLGVAGLHGVLPCCGVRDMEARGLGGEEADFAGDSAKGGQRDVVEFFIKLLDIYVFSAIVRCGMPIG
jgi:hypothetical protein